MNIQTLANILLELMDKHGRDVEVRIGDQVEAGPYYHDRVGGVWSSRPDDGGGVHYVIICAEDTQWIEEAENCIPEEGDELPLLWMPPPPIPGSIQEN